MFQLLPVLLGMLGGVVAAAIIMLYYRDIIEWFRGKTMLKQSDKDNIAFSIQERLTTGNIRTVQGIFNQRHSNVLEAKAYESKTVDAEVASLHRNNALVVYN
jgi:hypothetical protein